MMQTVIFTGPAGITALAAAATAAATAARGIGTLLASIGPAQNLGALVGGPASSAPRSIAPNLDLLAIDAGSELIAGWGELRARNTRPGPTINGDELPLLPGSDLLLGVSRLRRLGNSYEVACVDAGPPDSLLRTLAVPDAFRWSLRLLLGLDRGPGRSSASVARALLPTAFIPPDWTGGIQDARAQLERLRDELVEPRQTRVRYVLRPDRVGLEEARLALPALQLFGLAVEQLVVGPLLPGELSGFGLDELMREQASVVDEAAQLWAPRALLRLEAGATPGSPEDLAVLGAELYGDVLPLPGPAPISPVRLSGAPAPQVALDLPGLPREALGLTMSGDELIVRIGPFRRHLLLPEGLRGLASIRATRQGETLFVQPRGDA